MVSGTSGYSLIYRNENGSLTGRTAVRSALSLLSLSLLSVLLVLSSYQVTKTITIAKSDIA